MSGARKNNKATSKEHKIRSTLVRKRRNTFNYGEESQAGGSENRIKSTDRLSRVRRHHRKFCFPFLFSARSPPMPHVYHCFECIVPVCFIRTSREIVITGLSNLNFLRIYLIQASLIKTQIWPAITHEPWYCNIVIVRGRNEKENGQNCILFLNVQYLVWTHEGLFLKSRILEMCLRIRNW